MSKECGIRFCGEGVFDGYKFYINRILVKKADIGKSGEDAAVSYLEAEGYVILDRNWRCGHKELDIVCTDGKLIVVVEVKTRLNGEEYPAELLDAGKKRNLLRAGAAYIKSKGMEKELRFDLILLTGENLELTHYPEAILMSEN